MIGVIVTLSVAFWSLLAAAFIASPAATFIGCGAALGILAWSIRPRRAKA